MTSAKQEILFNKFEVIECFKKDEHTGVYLANHVYLSKRIILKVLNTATIPDPVIIERFKREAKLLAKLNHPNIINVLDFGTDNDFFYISFEYFQGTSLRAKLKKNKLTADQKELMLVQMLKGLDCAHRNGIIHRDIKPENIFINDKNELKIGDFGLAFDVSDNFVTTQHTIVGTPCYMAPEQISGDKITERSDLFSVGIVAYELFTGHNPFLGADVNETINNVISFDEDSLQQKILEIGGEVGELLSKLLKKDPAQRITSAKEALAFLKITDNTAAVSNNNGNNKYALIGILIIVVIASTVIIFLISTKDEKLTENTPTANVQKEIDSTKILSELNIEQPDETETGKLETIDDTNAETYGIENPVAEPSAIPETAPKFGSLYVECFPWADVIIDTEMIETTPLSGNIELSEGNHTLTLYNPVYPAFNKEIFIAADKLTSIRINMDTLFGYVDFKVYPWGEIYLDNKLIGQTPIQQPYKLEPGEYRTIIKNPSFESKDMKIVILRNDTLQITHNFEIN